MFEWLESITVFVLRKNGDVTIRHAKIRENSKLSKEILVRLVGRLISDAFMDELGKPWREILIWLQPHACIRMRLSLEESFVGVNVAFVGSVTRTLSAEEEEAVNWVAGELGKHLADAVNWAIKVLSRLKRGGHDAVN